MKRLPIRKAYFDPDFRQLVGRIVSPSERGGTRGS